LLRRTTFHLSLPWRSVAGRSILYRLFVKTNQRRTCWHLIPWQAQETAIIQGRILVFQPFSSSRSFILISSTEVVSHQIFLYWCLGLPWISISAAGKMQFLTWHSFRPSSLRRRLRPPNRLRLKLELEAVLSLSTEEEPIYSLVDTHLCFQAGMFPCSWAFALNVWGSLYGIIHY